MNIEKLINELSKNIAKMVMHKKGVENDL